MARAIDSEKYMELLKEQYLHYKAMKHGEAARAWQGAIQLLYDMPTLTPPNDWISVEDRLPERNQDVIMYFDGGNMAVGWWHDNDEDITFWCAYTDDGFYTDCECIPTHWMPLPQPPKEE